MGRLTVPAPFVVFITVRRAVYVPGSRPKGLKRTVNVSVPPAGTVPPVLSRVNQERATHERV